MKYFKIVVLCMLTLGVGAGAMAVFILAKREPAKVVPEAPRLAVHVKEVHPESVQIRITGYGPVRARMVVPITPEVAGRIVEAHPRLDAGEVIPEGEVLFRIDPRTYDAAVKSAQAAAARSMKTLERLRIQYAKDKERIETLRRTRDLAKAEFDRVTQLFQKDQVGTQAGCEAAERAYNVAYDAVAQLEELLATYPVQIEEAQHALEAANAQLDQAEINLDRTCVRAPFDARIKSQSVKEGQYVGPGAPIMTLADDALLEVSAPLDARVASRWLEFSAAEASERPGWFRELEPVTAGVYWTEDEQRHWAGVVHRVERYDESTRTVYVVIRVAGPQTFSLDDARLPLLEGMFCRVEIPGKTIDGVYRVPRSAVTFAGKAYVAVDDRLETRDVTLVHEQGGEALVREGLQPGDRVITTRLVDPLENALLDVSEAGDSADAGGAAAAGEAGS